MILLKVTGKIPLINENNESNNMEPWINPMQISRKIWRYVWKKILQVQKSSYHGGLVRLIDNLEPLERVMFHCNCNWIAIEALRRINLAEESLIKRNKKSLSFHWSSKNQPGIETRKKNNIFIINKKFLNREINIFITR